MCLWAGGVTGLELSPKKRIFYGQADRKRVIGVAYNEVTNGGTESANMCYQLQEDGHNSLRGITNSSPSTPTFCSEADLPNPTAF